MGMTKGMPGDYEINEDMADIIKTLCKERLDRTEWNFKRACKGCPYRDRTGNPLCCCMFGNVPAQWGGYIEKPMRMSADKTQRILDNFLFP